MDRELREALVELIRLTENIIGDLKYAKVLTSEESTKYIEQLETCKGPLVKKYKYRCTNHENCFCTCAHKYLHSHFETCDVICRYDGVVAYCKPTEEEDEPNE